MYSNATRLCVVIFVLHLWNDIVGVWNKSHRVVHQRETLQQDYCQNCPPERYLPLCGHFPAMLTLFALLVYRVLINDEATKKALIHRTLSCCRNIYCMLPLFLWICMYGIVIAASIRLLNQHLHLWFVGSNSSGCDKSWAGKIKWIVQGFFLSCS